MSPVKELVIVGGTHLCLLPELSSSSSPSTGDRKGSKNRSRSKCDNVGMTTGDGEETKMVVDVPAVSLSLIREYFIGGGGGGKCIYPFINNDDDDQAAMSKNSEEGLDGLQAKAMTRTDIQTIRLRASDLMCDNTNNDNINDNYYGSRCVHYSTNLTSANDGQPSTVVRIIASPEDIEMASMQYITPEEDIMSDNDDYDTSNCNNSNILEIILPSLDSLSFNNANVDNSLLYSSRRRRRHDGVGSREVIYYGGEQHGILSSSTTTTNDTNNLDDFDKDYTNEENDKKESYSYNAIEVHGAASVLVHDFLGIPGLEQCLILPRLFTSSRTTTTATTRHCWQLVAMVC